MAISSSSELDRRARHAPGRAARTSSSSRGSPRASSAPSTRTRSTAPSQRGSRRARWTRSSTRSRRPRRRSRPVYDMSQVIEPIQQLEAIGTIATVEDPDLGPVRMQNVLFRMSETPGTIRHTGRAHGADTEEVLARARLHPAADRRAARRRARSDAGPLLRNSSGSTLPPGCTCPAARPDRFAKAAAAADGVVIDLEDAVHPAERADARGPAGRGDRRRARHPDRGAGEPAVGPRLRGRHRRRRAAGARRRRLAPSGSRRWTAPPMRNAPRRPRLTGGSTAG